MDGRYRGRRYGELLLMDARQRAWRHSASIASAAVIVDAKDEDARRFYERYDFRRFPESPFRLFLPMKKGEQLAGRG